MQHEQESKKSKLCRYGWSVFSFCVGEKGMWTWREEVQRPCSGHQHGPWASSEFTEASAPPFLPAPGPLGLPCTLWPFLWVVPCLACPWPDPVVASRLVLSFPRRVAPMIAEGFYFEGEGMGQQRVPRAQALPTLPCPALPAGNKAARGHARGPPGGGLGAPPRGPRALLCPFILLTPIITPTPHFRQRQPHGIHMKEVEWSSCCR